MPAFPALDGAMNRVSAINERPDTVVELRDFGRLNHEEIGESPVVLYLW